MAVVKLSPIHPNPGIEDEYIRKVMKLLKAMGQEIWRVELKKRAIQIENPDMASDAKKRETPEEILEHYQKEFDKLADRYAPYFVDEVNQFVSQAFVKDIKKKTGLGIKISQQSQLTLARKTESILENISLIKSIPAQYYDKITNKVLEASQKGFDVKHLAKDLNEIYGQEKRRTQFIAQDQTAKVTSLFVRTRMQDLGIQKGEWMHSGAGKRPRPSHVAADGKVFNLNEGLVIEGKFTFPGEEPRCRCVTIPLFEILGDNELEKPTNT